MVFVLATLTTLGCRQTSPTTPAATPTLGAPQPSTAPPSPTAAPAAAVPTAVPGVLPDASATPVPLPSVLTLSAPTRNVVWGLLAGERLFESGDRGSTWQPRGLPPRVGNVEVTFINEREGWLASAGSPATQYQQQSLALWHTLDAGTSWTPLPATGIATAQCKSGIVFADAARGFFVAADPNHAPVVYRTGDGGLTWAASAPLPDPAGFTSQPGGFTLQARVLHVFGQTLLLPVEAGGARHVYRSTDGGASWTDVATVPGREAALALVTATRWFLVAVPDGSSETTDGGMTWHPFTSDYSQASPVAPVISFGDPEVGYATTRGGLQRTVDGGSHWTKLVTPGTR